jgi:hypothetical protein
LNLLCEQIEFAPCTEHNRVSSYEAHLDVLAAHSLMATCPGIELTGSVFTVNHQNAFPLRAHPRTQDGGGPLTDPHPAVQIERLALWDEASEKLVQQNHPDIVQLLADKDLDGKADGGFREVFGRMDVIEVQPPASILSPPDPNAQDPSKRNRIFHWLQLLNLGYRIPGVVNTDAHYNHHGSGFVRNYIKSSTDDPARVHVLDLVRAAERGNMIMSSGPFLEVSLSAAGATANGQARGEGPATATAGELIKAPGGQGTLTIRVQCPNWLDVNRVLVLYNGRPAKGLDLRRRDHSDGFAEGTVKFHRTLSLDFASDTHVIVVAAGEGLGLGPIAGPQHEHDMPVAVSNPIYVDVDGNGFEASGDLLEWALPIADRVLPE